VLGAPVLNRPWEWVENLGDFPAADTKDDDEERGRHPIKNSASLSLDLFNARVTGDGIVLIDQYDSRIEGNVRSFEDSLTAESVFKRDWRETRVELDSLDVLVGGGVNRAEEVDELGGLPSFPRTTERLSASHSLRASPVSASSIRSHQSTILSAAGSSVRSSPHQQPLQPPPLPRSSISSASDPIDVDAPVTTSSTSTRRTSKRKITSSDDEIEIVDGPNPAPSQVGKKSKGKPTTKARVKKR
jgi:mediator of RNA polymerase II transcription subunit 12